MYNIDLTEGEEIIASTKRHWTTLIPSVILVLISIGIAVGFSYLHESVVASVENGIEKCFENLADGFGFIFSIVGLGVMLFLMVGACIGLPMDILALKKEYFILTNKRIYGRRGVIAKSELNIVLEKIDTVRIQNSILGRLFHYATIEIISPASSRIENGNTVYEGLGDISNAQEFQKAVLDTIEQHKKQAEQQTEAVG